ncbi:mRNA-decapping enzyme-like protein [Fusarium oxysporum f. sp. albedinis]|nr:mRNA-decapping enzyme-like protein [Fusarium oxysporum f. sp. albedinis]
MSIFIKHRPSYTTPGDMDPGNVQSDMLYSTSFNGSTWNSATLRRSQIRTLAGYAVRLGKRNIEYMSHKRVSRLHCARSFLVM